MGVHPQFKEFLLVYKPRGGGCQQQLFKTKVAPGKPGFDPIQQEQMVLAYIDKHGSIKRSEVMDLCRISGPQAYHFLKRLKEKG